MPMRNPRLSPSSTMKVLLGFSTTIIVWRSKNLRDMLLYFRITRATGIFPILPFCTDTTRTCKYVFDVDIGDGEPIRELPYFVDAHNSDYVGMES